jgi:hypothetical protein
MDPVRDEDGILHWSMGAEREITQSFDAVYITQLVQGLGISKAQSNLERNLPSSSAPKIQLSPSWWRWMPMLPFRIEVITK